MVRRPAGEARRQAQRDRRPHPEGDHRPAHLPARRRARLSHARARVRHAVGRREPAHPARLADRLGPHRRALCARRAVDRPPPARQRAPARNAEAPARPRQHGDRRRARRGCDLDRRLRRRRRPGRRRARRRDRRRGDAGRDRGEQAFADRPLSLRRADDRDPGTPRAQSGPQLKVVGARGNNLKNVTAKIPLGLFTCVTGVSGGGKSTLVIDTLYKAVARKLNGASEPLRRTTASTASSRSTR